MFTKFYTYLAIAMLVAFAQACQTVNKNYHDTCLHYNKYFLANEKMKEMEQSLWKNHKDDYNSVLSVYPDYDTNFSKTLKGPADECIKKASIGIDWHGGTTWSRDSWNGESRWADNAFILIGKSRLYSSDFKNAKETFKFVNTKTKNDNDRQESLIWLANTHTKNNEFFSAAEIFNQLAEEKMNKRNKREYYIAKTYFHSKVGEYAHANKYVQKAIPLTSRWVYKRDKRARLHFIAAQIYQMYNRDSSAYLNYNKTIKNNPSYELGFYARLYAAQVADVESAKQNKKMQKYFKKMLKDPKNKEYNDKIYYEMANYELKFKNYNKAVENLYKSLKAEVQNPTQRGYTFLKLGELNYDVFKNYSKAKNFYDSALATLPKTHKDYKKISKRKNILDEFGKYYDIIVLEDSLQKLAKLDSLQLKAKLAAMVEADFKKQKDEFLALKKAEKLKADKEALAAEQKNNAIASTDPNAKWYFYNTAQLQNGISEFKKNWGNRPLEDHWRRSVKDRVELSPEEQAAAEQQKQAEEKAKLDPNLPKPDKDGFLGKKLEVNELSKNIPFTAEQQKASNDRIIDAMFHLSKIYHFKLEELENAADGYLGMNSRFPNNVNEGNALYLLYLIYLGKDDVKAKLYKDQLLSKHPENEFAKSMIDPDWRIKENADYRKYEAQYTSIFNLYEAKHYKETDTLAVETLEKNPETPFKGKINLLRVLVDARTKDVYEYRKSLMAFKESNKDSSLYAYTDKLIKQLDDRIKLKEEIEKQWKARLDSVENAKLNVLKNTEVNSQDMNNKMPYHEINSSPESTLPLNNTEESTPNKIIQEGKPTQEGEQINKNENIGKTVINTELPEEQLGVDPTIPPKKK